MTNLREKGPITLPANTPVAIKGALEGDDQDTIQGFIDAVGGHLAAISQYIDLSGLGGVTIATDFAAAIAEVDRGAATPDTSTRPTRDGIAVGVAMTISVLRSSDVKSHIVFSHLHVRPILNADDTGPYGLAVHALAHECAHVELQHRFDSAFPNQTLRPAPATWTALDHQKWRYAIQLTFDEYAATCLSAPFGANPLPGYVEALLKTLDRASSDSNDLLRNWLVDGDFTKVFHGMFKTHGDLLVRSAYVLGTMDGLGMKLDDVPELRERFEGNDFEPYFKRLHEICRSLLAEIGEWTAMDDFHPIGDLLGDIVASKGVAVKLQPDGSLWVDVDRVAAFAACLQALR